MLMNTRRKIFETSLYGKDGLKRTVMSGGRVRGGGDVQVGTSNVRRFPGGFSVKNLICTPVELIIYFRIMRTRSLRVSQLPVNRLPVTGCTQHI